MRVLTLLQAPLESYPVLYKAYWQPELDEDNRIKNDRSHNSVLSTVFDTYYTTTLDLTTLDDITYPDPTNPWKIVFIIVYPNTDGTIGYLWEYFDNWVDIVYLNRD